MKTNVTTKPGMTQASKLCIACLLYDVKIGDTTGWPIGSIPVRGLFNWIGSIVKGVA